MLELALLFCLLLFTKTQAVGQSPDELQPLQKPVNLFDGSDVRQWMFYCGNDKVDMKDVWKIEDKVLKCTGNPKGYLQTKRWFRDLPARAAMALAPVSAVATVAYWFIPRLHCFSSAGQSRWRFNCNREVLATFGSLAKVLTFRLKIWKSAAKSQRAGNQHSHRRIRRIAGEYENEVGQWNDMRIVCREDEIKVYVNNKLVNHGTEMTVSQGAIALQSEGTPIDFRDIRLSPLNNNSDDK